ncbi:MAG: RDD family protein [Wolbachia endosymbiont of Tyrophagus putrescentiae]|nr:RDD family protein [Wolbachia endosymbiont of Tyrophagus putrescentiae]
MTNVVEIASIQRRFCAYLIDVIILLIPTLLLTVLLQNFPLGLYLAYMCVSCSYFAYFTSANNQATPGQQLIGIRTINIDNHKISIHLAFDRSISQYFLPLLNKIQVILISLFEDFSDTFAILQMLITLLTICWYLVACFSKKKQTFHDMLFNTVVVKVTHLS